MNPTPILALFAVILLIVCYVVNSVYTTAAASNEEVITVVNNISALNESMSEAQQSITSLQMASAANGLMVSTGVDVPASNFVNVDSGAVNATATWVTLSANSQLVFVKTIVSQNTASSTKTSFNLQLTGSTIWTIDFIGCISAETNTTRKDIYNVAQFTDPTQNNMFDISYTSPAVDEAHTINFIAMVTLVTPST